MEDRPVDRVLALARRAGARVVSARLGPGGPVARLRLPDGWAVARYLCALVDDDGNTPGVQALGGAIARGAVSPREIAERVRAWVVEAVDFRREPGEIFQAPLYTLKTGRGDCDCQARLVAAVARAAGVPARLAFLAEGGQPAHVFAELLLENGWAPVETTIAAEVGEAPLDAARRAGVRARPDLLGDVWLFSPGGRRTLQGLGDVLPEEPERSGAGWQDDPARTRWAAALFSRLAPSWPAKAIHAALAISGVETGIGRSLGWNFGGIMARTQPTGDPPACPVGSRLGWDVTRQDGVRRPVCFSDPSSASAGASAFLDQLRISAPSQLVSGDAERIAREMFAHHYYAGTTSVSDVEIARYAAALDGAGSVVARHLGSAQLVARGSVWPIAVAIAVGTAAIYATDGG